MMWDLSSFAASYILLGRNSSPQGHSTLYSIVLSGGLITQNNSIRCDYTIIEYAEEESKRILDAVKD